MYKFRELTKASKKEVDGKKYKLAVLGTCATQFFSQCIEGYAHLEGLNLDVFDADYNQLDAQLRNPLSETYEYSPDYILLYIATEKLYEEFMELSIDDKILFADNLMCKIRGYWELIEGYSNAKILQMNFTEIDDKTFGSYGNKVSASFVYQIRKLNYLLQSEMEQIKSVYPIDILAVQIELGMEKFFDPVIYYNAKVNVALNTWPYVAKAVYDVISAALGKIKKCVVLDLDNTLWGGVIGDDGLANIEIGELGRGHAFTNFQKWLKGLKDRGILLAVCSKNNEDIAKEPFEKHEEMVLRLDDFSIFVANWNDKASNIKYIQQVLNIGMDSLVFIDDNEFERNLVRDMIPEICVPELPSDPAKYLSFLQEQNLFETVSFSNEDANRTSQYQAEAKRKISEATFDSIEGYLESLEMVAEVRPFDELKYSRIAQLTQRSNQFNLRTIRYTEDEIARLADDSEYVTLYFTLRDKFGDHGLVSVVIMKKMSNEELFIDTWLMSCRVLKRGMEEFVVNSIVEEAKTKGFLSISSEYIPTPKNVMVKDIYEAMGFEKTTEYGYHLNVDDYKSLKTYIKER